MPANHTSCCVAAMTTAAGVSITHDLPPFCVDSTKPEPYAQPWCLLSLRGGALAQTHTR